MTKKNSRVRRILKDKSNWSSLVILILALASAAYSFFTPDDAYSGKALSLAVGLITLEFFVLIVVHLEDIQSALERVENHAPKGAQLNMHGYLEMGTIIEEAKEELFFCGWALSRITSHRNALLATAEKVPVRLLVIDFSDETVCNSCLSTFGRNPGLMSLEHLDWLRPKKNIAIRTISFPVSMHISARDVCSSTGHIQVAFQEYGSVGKDTPCVELTPADSELFAFYKEQIELLWSQGKPFEP